MNTVICWPVYLLTKLLQSYYFHTFHSNERRMSEQQGTS